MAELVDKEKIRKELEPVLSALVDDVLKVAGEAGRSLEAAVLFGSVVGNNYVPRKSDVNIFMVFDKADLALLKGLQPVFNRYFKKLKSRPVVVDRDFIENSSDVFPMEFFEWKDRSRVIYGENPLDGVEISQTNLRLQIEENLRGKRMKLIQAFLEMAPRRKRLQGFVEEVLPNFITILRNILRLKGEAPNRDAVGLIDGVEETVGVRLSSMRRFQRIKVDGVKIGRGELEILFRDFLEELDALTRFVDEFEVEK